MKTKISVVIPTYSRPDLLGKCLDALMHQDFEKDAYEVIVVSDGPDEETEKQVLQINSFNFHAYALPSKYGPAAARNAGWRKAKGELICFTDDDCMPDRRWLSYMWHAYTKNNLNDKPMAFSGHTYVPVSNSPTDYERNISKLESAEFITANCACTRNALELAGGFDERFTLAWREDSDFHFRLIEHNIETIKVHAALVVHPVRLAKWGISIKEQEKSKFDALLYNNHPSLFRERIRALPILSYYIIIGAFLLMLTGIILHSMPLTIFGAATYALFTIAFIWKRVSGADRSIRHLTEMIFTSLLIPFLSVFWTWYGSIRYKTFLF